ncbi:hypothetical protein WJX81_007169 [Elliptochloris bilobata]|uniref:ACT domain-containing protein n=1 Tax=Elliptochloris bilobata TaxID=381761 RepID=A0AAW1RIK5_9CHLO
MWRCRPPHTSIDGGLATVPLPLPAERHPRSAGCSSGPRPCLQQGRQQFRQPARHCPQATSGLDTMTERFGGPEEIYDVYVNQPEPLEEGVEKHVISVFVADESGIINRVAGVFARRGANIESLAVGLNIDKALFTIVVAGTQSVVANLVKQLAKLVKVRYVEDITHGERVERELVLFKIRAPPGPTRMEVLQLVEIFRARVADVSERSVTLGVTGDAGKTTAMERALSKFGILEIARTGKISLKRGSALLQMGGWGDSSTRREHQARGAAEQPQAASAEGLPGSEPDVYMVDEHGGEGVWQVDNLLDAPTYAGEFEPHTLSIEVEDRPGVLNQVTGVLARRGYNVQSLAVGHSEVEGQSRITTVIPGSPEATAKLVKQLNKLVYVLKVTDLSAAPFVKRELALIKVRCEAAQRRELSDLAAIFHGTICDVSLSTVTLEMQGKETKIGALQGLLAPYGILEVARTGRVALARDSGVDTRFLQRMKGSRVML